MHTRRLLFVLLIAVLVLPTLAIVPFAGAQEGPPQVGLRPDAPPYALHGPYWVGNRELVIEPESERPLPLTVWYPALNPAEEEEAITYVYGAIGNAINEATPDGNNGPYPLIIYVHPASSLRIAAVYLGEHLASWGFVVMAVNYADNQDTTDPSFQMYSTVYSRPRDVVRQIDYADWLNRAGQGLDGMIDTERVAIMGHDWGGYTAYAASGAQIDNEWFNRMPVEHPEACIMPVEMGGENWCALIFLNHQEKIAELAGLENVPDRLWPSWGDPRIDAMIGFAPDGYGFGPEGLKGVTVPVMLMTGSQDRFNPPEVNVHQPYEFVGSTEKSKVVFEGGDHMMFANNCGAVPWLVDLGLFWGCSDPVWDMDRAHDLINHFATAFFLATLKDDAEAAAALAPDQVAFPGITYEAQGF